MANVAVIGAQWGDEGKGKVVDWLASRADIVVRFQGGHNAGHTLVVGNETYKLSLLPSGLVRGKIGIIGNGVVVDPEALLAEIERVRTQGIDVTPATLRIAENATLILPMHPALDRAREAARGDRKIGTTGRGIGPAYEDKAARRAIRVADLAEPETLADKLDELLLHHNTLLQGLGAETFSKDGCARAADSLWRRRSCRSPNRCGSGWTRRGGPGRRILFEGAQAVMLDVDHGTYPYVTSSNTVAATAASGAGVGPSAVGFVLGIAKAYSTRVGSGPFPTELSDATGQLLGDRGNEYGTSHRPPPALRLVRRGAGAPGGEGRRHQRSGADQARRAGRAAGAEDLHRLPDPRRALPAPAGGTRRAGRGRTGIRGDGGLDRLLARRALLGRSAGAGGEVRAPDRGTGGGAGDAAVHQPRARRHDPDAGSVRGVAAVAPVITDPQPFSRRIGRDMADLPATPPTGALIADQYAVDPSRRLPPVGGLAAFAAIDSSAGRTDLMAIQLHRQLPPRPRAFQALAAPVDGLLTPWRTGRSATPATRSAWRRRAQRAGPHRGPGPRAELLECVLRPAAHVLEHLQARG